MKVSKSEVYLAIKAHIHSRVDAAQAALDEATESVHAETKGSAGDKHETGRAMAQLEMEQAGKVLQETRQMTAVLNLLEPEKHRESCTIGALAETSQGIFYLAAGIGRLTVGTTEVFCISMHSPIGQALLDKKAGAHYVAAGKQYTILSVE